MPSMLSTRPPFEAFPPNTEIGDLSNTLQSLTTTQLLEAQTFTCQMLSCITTLLYQRQVQPPQPSSDPQPQQQQQKQEEQGGSGVEVSISKALQF